MPEHHVLIVEDAEDIRVLVRSLLERNSFRVSEAADGRAGLQRFFAGRPDLVVLDVGLPGLDGWTVLERIRELSDVPVLMLTAQGTELQKVRGLRAGADDYVVKPFGRQELLARVEALLRRTGTRGKGTGADAPEVLDDGLLLIDFVAHRVTASGEEVALTPLEFRLLTVLARHPGQLLTHDQLLDLVWGDEAGDGRERVKLYVGYLRRKLEAAAAVNPIETIRGLGYRYRPSAA